MSSSRKIVPVARPFAPPPPGTLPPVVQLEPIHQGNVRNRRPRPAPTSAAPLKAFLFLVMAVVCMGAGWLVIRIVTREPIAASTTPQPTYETSFARDTYPEPTLASIVPPTFPPTPAPKPPTTEERPPATQPPPTQPPATVPPATQPPATQQPPTKPATQPTPTQPPTTPKPTMAKPTNPTTTAVAFDKIQPILQAKCIACHNQGRETKKGDLDMTSLASLKRGGKSGPSITPGKLDGPFWADISSNRMPPRGRTPLSSDEKKLIETWLVSGAQDRGTMVVGKAPKK